MSANNDVVRRAFESLLVQARGHKQRPPTIAAVAARAGNLRSSMYRFHPAVASVAASSSFCLGAGPKRPC